MQSSIESAADVPAGFRPIPFAVNPFMDRVGPIYARLDPSGLKLGFRVESHHCNPGGHCHGGMLMTLADMLLILGSNVAAGIARYLVTVSLSQDFVDAVPRGAWIEGQAEVLRVTGSLVFAQGQFFREERVVLRTSGILKPTGPTDPRFDPRVYLKG